MSEAELKADVRDLGAVAKYQIGGSEDGEADRFSR